MQIRIVLAISVLLTFLLGADAAPAWKMYSPSEGSYQVLLPGTPREEWTVQSGMPAHAVKADADVPNDFFFMIVTIYLPEQSTIRSREDAERFLAGAMATYQERPDIEVLASEDISLSGIPGRDFVADGFEGRRARFRMYAVADRWYTVSVLSKDPKLFNSEKANRYFDSFQLLELPASPLGEPQSEYELVRMFGVEIASVGIGLVLTIAIAIYLLRRRRSGASLTHSHPSS
jgi:hypothetical protein